MQTKIYVRFHNYYCVELKASDALPGMAWRRYDKQRDSKGEFIRYKHKKYYADQWVMA